LDVKSFLSDTVDDVAYWCPADWNIFTHPEGPGMTRVTPGDQFLLRWETSWVQLDEDVSISLIPLFNERPSQLPADIAYYGSVGVRDGRLPLRLPKNLAVGNYTFVAATSQSDWFFLSSPIYVC
jgi:hypothetical protein